MRAARRFPGPGDHAIGGELKERIMQTVGSMSPTVQDVFRCRIFDGMTNGETSEALDISRRSASYALSVAREKLSSEIRWAWPDDVLARSA